MLQKKQKMLQKQLKKKPNNTIHLVKNGFWLFRVRFLLLIIYTLNNSTIIKNIHKLTVDIVYKVINIYFYLQAVPIRQAGFLKYRVKVV